MTKFGKTIRKMRIDRDLSLESMARGIKISPSYLSSIEMGKRAIPRCLLKRIENLKIFNTKELKEIKSSINDSIAKFSFRPKNDYQRNLMVILTKSFNDLTATQVEAICKIMEEPSDTTTLTNKKTFLTLAEAKKGYYYEFEEGVYKYAKDCKWTLIENGEVLIDGADWVHWEASRSYLYCNDDEYTLIENGKVLIDNVDNVQRYEPGLYICKKDGKMFQVKDGITAEIY